MNWPSTPLFGTSSELAILSTYSRRLDIVTHIVSSSPALRCVDVVLDPSPWAVARLPTSSSEPPAIAGPILIRKLTPRLGTTSVPGRRIRLSIARAGAVTSSGYTLTTNASFRLVDYRKPIIEPESFHSEQLATDLMRSQPDINNAAKVATPQKFAGWADDLVRLLAISFKFAKLTQSGCGRANACVRTSLPGLPPIGAPRQR
jgi:hypothetical protein